MPRQKRSIDACPHTERDHYSQGMCKSCYYKSRQEQGLYDRAEADRNYEQSEAGKARMDAYNQSEKGKVRKKTWKRKQKQVKE